MKRRSSSVLVSVSLALLSCARPQPPQAAGEADPLAVARLEARREGGSQELSALTRGPVGPATMRAIRGLGRIGDGQSLAWLARLLGSDTPELREAAARAFDVAAALGAELEEMEPKLLRRWPEASARERVAIVEGVRRLGSAGAVPRLAEALAPDQAAELREAAALALGIFGRRGISLDARAREGLVALAAENDPKLVYAAAYALAHEHAPGAGREAADAALSRLTAARDPEVRALAVKGVARGGGPAEARLAALRGALGDPDAWVRVAAARGLASLGEPAATAALWDWLTAEIEASNMSDRTGSLHPVLEALSLFTARPEAVPGAAELHARVERAPAGGTPAARRGQARVACGLASLAARRDDWRPPLVCAEAVGFEADRERRIVETGLLGHGWGGPVERRLERLRALAGDPDPGVRAAAIEAAARAWDAAQATVEAMLIAALADDAAAVAGAAAEAVQARFGGDAARPAPGPGLVDALVRRAGGERDGELFAALAGALGRVGGTRGLSACEAGLGHASATVRAAARACVKSLRGEDPGRTQPNEPAPRPPVDPALVLGEQVLWRLTTERGTIEIALDPEAAPWHVAALVALTRRGFYDGLTFHRVVPGFVVQGGDPSGTGWGGPGFSLPSEPGEGSFARGAVGIADAGKDTGGSQFFIMHARAPHLEGRYTRVGQVRAGIEVADALIVGDRIVRAEALLTH